MALCYRDQWSTVFLSLGSNLGDRVANLTGAVKLLDQGDGVIVRAASSLYETEPVGGPPEQSMFLNAVIRIATALEPEQLLDVCQQIEQRLGRVRSVPNGPRTIDLDILLFGDRIVSTPRLTIPHPRMHERGFVLMPLAELDPAAVHPLLNVSVQTLLQDAVLGNGHRVMTARGPW